MIGAFVEPLDTYAVNPTDPGACSAAVESVVVSCQAVGSVPEAAHTFA